jgi:hypothetical protein
LRLKGIKVIYPIIRKNTDIMNLVHELSEETTYVDSVRVKLMKGDNLRCQDTHGRMTELLTLRQKIRGGAKLLELEYTFRIVFGFSHTGSFFGFALCWLVFSTYLDLM